MLMSIVPVPHLPQPGETVLGGDYSLLPGGKGANQAIAARRAGADVVMAGAVGGDGFAVVALDPLRRAGHRHRGWCAPVASADGLRRDHGVGGWREHHRRCFGRQRRRALRPSTGTVLGPDDVLVAQREVPPAETDAMIRRVRAAGGYVLLNLAPALAIGARPVARDRSCRRERAGGGNPRRRPGADRGKICVADLVVTRGAPAPPPIWSAASHYRCRHCRSLRSTPPARATPLSVCLRRRSIPVARWARHRSKSDCGGRVPQQASLVSREARRPRCLMVRQSTAASDRLPRRLARQSTEALPIRQRPRGNDGEIRRGSRYRLGV